MSRRRVLVTGAGGPAAVTLIQALEAGYDVVAADIDPVAVGLYLVPASRRVLLPRGDAPEFTERLLTAVREHRIDLLVPTVDVELPHVAAAEGRFRAAGARVLVESEATLALCLDKARLVEHCAPLVRVPRTLVLDATTTPQAVAALGETAVLKPRRGAGGRGVEVRTDLPHALEAGALRLDGTLIVQEHLPGEEFSIDVLARPDGHVVAAVPRRRDKVDSGIAVAGRTVADPALVDFGLGVARAIGARGVVNVQAKRAVDGAPGLLEVNPRFPGTMSLTRAAGIDMPLLAVRGALGETLPDHLDFREVAVVRHWADVVVPVEEYAP